MPRPLPADLPTRAEDRYEATSPGPAAPRSRWTLARVGGRCVREFGQMRNGNGFGRNAQYGKVGPGTIGAFAGTIRRDPDC